MIGPTAPEEAYTTEKATGVSRAITDIPATADSPGPSADHAAPRSCGRRPRARPPA